MIPQSYLIVSALLSLFSITNAHGGIYSYEIDGKTYPGNLWFEPAEDQETIQRRWYIWPVEDITSSNMTCNFDGSAPPGSRSLHASVPAGGEITAHWSNNFTFRKGLPFYCDPAQEERVCPPGYVCDFRCLYHHWYHDQGPLFAYLASCGDDCGSFDPSSEKVWFKIAESGLQPGATISGQGNPDEIKYSWKQGELTGATEKDKVGWSFKIPPGLKKGKYLLRVEILSLQLWPPQFYPECAQIEVTGEGGNAPAEHELVAFPGAYSYDDPGISVSGKMWTPASQGGVHDVKNYTMPGPPVWTG